MSKISIYSGDLGVPFIKITGENFLYEKALSEEELSDIYANIKSAVEVWAKARPWFDYMREEIKKSNNEPTQERK